MKKFELTQIRKIVHGVPVRRICAMYGFTAANGRQVKPGDLGGWVQCEKNLSQLGWAWLFDDAAVFDDGYVYDDACVTGEAEVSEHGRVSGFAQVGGNAVVGMMAQVCGRSQVRDHASVLDHALVYGNAVVSGNAILLGRPCITLHADISGPCDYVQIGPVGSRDDIVTFFRDSQCGTGVSCGCFHGSLERFLEKVKQTHGGSAHADAYLLSAQLAGIRLHGQRETEEIA